MTKQQNQQQQPVVAQQQTVTNKQRRLQQVQQALYNRHIAAKQQRYQVAVATFNQKQQALAQRQQAEIALQQVAAQYGLNAAALLAATARANSATKQPSANQVVIAGVQYTPCKAVHVLAAQHRNRKATIAAAVAAGVNPATAATQWGVWLKNNKHLVSN